MLQAFVIVLREGFESFLIVAITATYLQKTSRSDLIPALGWGVVTSVIVSVLLGYLFLQGSNQALWEGVFGLVAAFLVTWLIIHMWRMAPRLKQDMENHLSRATSGKTTAGALIGVFLFTVLMISREGMETALLLIQVREPKLVTGILLGLGAAVLMSFAWMRFGYLINLKHFFQVTAVFLLLFVVQIVFYSLHEFSEAGVLPNSEAFHKATEPFAAEGRYGKWFSFGMVGVCALWLAGAWLKEHFTGVEGET
jgi:high-affinity iron transporter